MSGPISRGAWVKLYKQLQREANKVCLIAVLLLYFHAEKIIASSLIIFLDFSGNFICSLMKKNWLIYYLDLKKEYNLFNIWTLFVNFF
uniref:Uncharacterized protein n=1 Tax=Heterorhabditis bacteriophora TaxID=37862 RepID=A0A1I7WNT2_HETBA